MTRRQQHERVLAGRPSKPASTIGAAVAVQTIQQGEGFQTNRLNGERSAKWTVSPRAASWVEAERAVHVFLSVYGGQDQSDIWLIKIDNPFTTEDDGDTNPYRSGTSNDPHMDLKTTGVNLTSFEVSDAVAPTT